jgi:tight adherence protein B
MNLGLGLFALVLFIAVVFLLEGAYVLWNDYKGPEVQRMERRLRALAAGDGSQESRSLLKVALQGEPTWLTRLLVASPRASAIDRWLQQSGSNVSVGRFVLVSTMAGVSVALLAMVLRLPLPLALLLGAVGFVVPAIVVTVRRSRRLRRFDEQLPDCLDLIARALRAGHAFPSALQMVGSEAADPVASEFQTTFEEINYGVSVHDAMLNLARRVPSLDLRYFVVAVLLQRETGGNLAELLDNLSALIRQRFKLLGRIRVLAAEGKLSAYILIGLPFVTAATVYAVNPKFMSLLWTDPAGLRLSAGAMVMMVLGAMVMWRIVKIRV